MVAVNMGYVVDHVYGALLHRTRISPPFFSRGWGGTKLELLERMINQMFPEIQGQNWPPALVHPVWKTKTACLREGVVTRCFSMHCLPRATLQELPFSLVSPKSCQPQRMACVVHLAGTGDHSFERRLSLGGPLLKENIATLVLESPFYGRRRPLQQYGAKLLCVSDLLLLGRATIEEARSLLHWLDYEAGFGKMGVCGLSMGKAEYMLLWLDRAILAAMSHLSFFTMGNSIEPLWKDLIDCNGRNLLHDTVRD